jgi:hypothetical protein
MINNTTEKEILDELYDRDLRSVKTDSINTNASKKIKVNNHEIPDPKLHQQISFIKSGIRILGYAALWWSIDIAAILLILAEVVGIGEELV